MSLDQEQVKKKRSVTQAITTPITKLHGNTPQPYSAVLFYKAPMKACINSNSAHCQLCELLNPQTGISPETVTSKTPACIKQNISPGRLTDRYRLRKTKRQTDG